MRIEFQRGFRLAMEQVEFVQSELLDETGTVCATATGIASVSVE